MSTTYLLSKIAFNITLIILNAILRPCVYCILPLRRCLYSDKCCNSCQTLTKNLCRCKSSKRNSNLQLQSSLLQTSVFYKVKDKLHVSLSENSIQHAYIEKFFTRHYGE